MEILTTKFLSSQIMVQRPHLQAPHSSEAVTLSKKDSNLRNQKGRKPATGKMEKKVSHLTSIELVCFSMLSHLGQHCWGNILMRKLLERKFGLTG